MANAVFFFFFFLMKAIDKIQNSAPSTKGARPASERMYSYVFFRFVALQQYSIHFQQFTDCRYDDKQLSMAGKVVGGKFK